MRRRSSQWRIQVRERIKLVGTRILQDNPQVDLKELRTEISKAYPWGLRENHPYQVWLSELCAYIKWVKFNRTGWLTASPHSAAKGYGANKGKRKTVPVAEGQLGLFDMESNTHE